MCGFPVNQDFFVKDVEDFRCFSLLLGYYLLLLQNNLDWII